MGVKPLSLCVCLPSANRLPSTWIRYILLAHFYESERYNLKPVRSVSMSAGSAVRLPSRNVCPAVSAPTDSTNVDSTSMISVCGSAEPVHLLSSVRCV